MSDDNHGNSIWKTFVFLVVLLVFGITAYWGYLFISEAERSAAGILNPDFNKNNNLDFSKLDTSIPLPTNRSLPAERNQNAGALNHSGQDLQIKAGEFAYQNGQPIVRIALQNHGSFTMTAAAVNLSLFLNDNKDAIASAVGIPIAFSQPLEPYGETVVSVPVSGEEWQQEEVRMAQSRRILAQIISVSDGNNQNMEYSQNGQGVYLKQTTNDWGATINASSREHVNNGAVRREPPPDFTDPTAGMNLEMPATVQAIKIEPVTDFKVENNPLESNDKKQENTFRQPEKLQPIQNALPEENQQGDGTDANGVMSYEIKSFLK